MARTRKLPKQPKAKKEGSDPAQKRSRIIKPAKQATSAAAKPFKFIARPFKTKPFRFIGKIFAKIFFVNYIRESWQELRQVTWPGRRETLKLTAAVFIFAITFSLLIAVVDYGLDKLFKEVLL